MIIQSCAETDEWVGIFLHSMLPAENAQLFDEWCYIQNTARKLRNSVFFKHLPPLSTRPFPVAHAQYELSEKHYMCFLRALWMTAVALEHAQRVSRQLHSLIPQRLPLWRIQRMLCIESVNSLICHAGRLRSTILMRSYKIVHISPGKRLAWSNKQPKVLHIYQLFSRNHASQEKTETNTDVCNHKVPLRSDYWQLVIGNPLLNLSIQLWENSFTFDRCVVAVPRSGPADWRCLCWPQT